VESGGLQVLRKTKNMADLQISASCGHRRKLTTPRVDLSPMVDLGFLLITFFMYTTTLARPAVMDLEAPDRHQSTANGVEIPAEATLILLPASGHRIAYYNGLPDPAARLSWCGFTGRNDLRALLAREQARVRGLPGTYSGKAHKLHVLIKPDTAASWDDIVQVLDEMTIGAVPYYSMMHITADEQAALKQNRPTALSK
jgi:biopolymer transport protein ExbD